MQQDEQRQQEGEAPPHAAETFFTNFMVPGFNPDLVAVANLQQELVREAFEKAREREVK